jgi:argininosuccinate synthase
LDRIVLAYSGSLGTSVAISWLSETYGAEIVAATMDVGQGSALDDVRERALASGAVRAHVIDARDVFARDFILPSLQAGALYEGRSPLATALSRPLIAKHLVEIARIERAGAIADGSTGKENEEAGLAPSVRALDPDIAILAPVREWGLTRPQAIAYLRQRGIPVPATANSPYRTDLNLWGRTIACGVLDDPWQEPPDEVYVRTKSRADTPDTPASVAVEFVKGVPVTINGIALGLVELITSLDTIAGAHGVGRIDTVERRRAGSTSREVSEAPAATALHTAHRALQRLVIPRDLERLTSDLGTRYADLIASGLWYSPMRGAIDALVAKVQQTVTGVVRLTCFKGDCRVVGRRSPHASHDHGLATGEAGDTFKGTTVEGLTHS